MTPDIVLANEYTDVRCYGWIAPKPKPKLGIKEPKNPQQGREELARMREMSDAHLSQHRLPGQDDLKDRFRQLGQPMHSSQLVAKVLKINPFLVCEDSTNCRGNAGFYFSNQAGEKVFTGAHFKKGILAEFSVVETDAADLPVRVQYGWREVLLRLVRAGQLSLAQVLRAFGDTNTVQAKAWRRSVQKFRN